ncbi:hypothetical protein M406DRAFT_256443 [Cryphonectria parasitica EP155]|uniref:Zn(2)-C6 fungal-type domain-containing protein n=1 Tax=Cryphonectria parasitica (strain ATCC 38755 / EP155) TaxID=660469 RepID=A0A9P4Y1Y8_CRYP1|nr:uncharacterized protein M406DRAFT_256443 [Cryphonectria parasitica EP155]KAF3765487.1 hypothetical protein M406DRAFT_256443 [Cryphonectria parasitica EP155]
MQPTVRIISGGRAPTVPKYRHSCDRCQKVKVRCSQDKPRCTRCAQRNLRCVYSEWRAVGRPKTRPNPPRHAPEDFEEGPGRIRDLPPFGTIESESISWSEYHLLRLH